MAKVVEDYCHTVCCNDCLIKDECGEIPTKFIEFPSVCEHAYNKIKDITTKVNDNVEYPAHYNQGSVECIDAMISAFGNEKVQTYCHINAFKYLWRSDFKNGTEDIKKAMWYLKKYVDLDEQEGVTDND